MQNRDDRGVGNEIDYRPIVNSDRVSARHHLLPQAKLHATSTLHHLTSPIHSTNLTYLSKLIRRAKLTRVYKLVNNHKLTLNLKHSLSNLNNKFIRPTNRAARYTLLIVVILLTSLIPWLSSFFPASSSQLSDAATLLIHKPDHALDKTIAFNSHSSTYTINPNGLKPAAANSNSNVLVGQSSAGLYSAIVPTDLSKGISLDDNTNRSSFTLTPKFSTGGGSYSNGHFIYNLGNGSIQAVYTPESTQLAEDLILNQPLGSSLSFPYTLKLPTGYKAFPINGGSIAIEGGGKILFTLSAPTIYQSNGKSQGAKTTANAKLFLKGNNLTLLATNLSKLTYPINIDPSITINSANSMLLGNDEGGNNITSNQVSTGAQTGGAFNNTIASCPTGWTLNSTTYCTNTTSLPVATDWATSVVYNGYVYEIGGYTNALTATVDYAPINTDGSLGAWTATTSLPVAEYHVTSVVYNGYVYEIGGETTAAVATVDYAPICTGSNSGVGGCTSTPGTLGSWAATTSLPTGTYDATSVAYNGYVYEIGGYTTAAVATVDYAPINANGTLGAWIITISLPTGTYNATSVVYNGYVYEIGGDTTAATATVDYAPINANGTLGAWIVTTSLPVATEWATSVVYNGYVYEIGGGTSTVDYAPINDNGTLGTWIAITSLPAGTYYATSVVYNGYAYEIGGYTNAAVATVDYAKIAPAGWVSSPDSTDINTWGATTNLPSTGKIQGKSYYPDKATSVVYNGYAYEIGGCGGACPIATVDYAPINANGTLGAWTATTSLPAATDYATSVTYNGYVYEIGGDTTAATAAVYYALICTGSNSGVGGCSATAGTLGSWTATTSLPAATDSATSVVYNGYVYEIEDGTTVYYVPINANGTLGSWTATTSPLVTTILATSVAYNGYVYELGGINGATPIATVEYASINANGTLGTWTATTSLPQAVYSSTSVTYNGYVYELGGSTVNGSASTNGTVNYGLINNGGPGIISAYTATTSLPVATHWATSVVYNGYVYEIGGESATAVLTTVDYAPINTNGTLGSWTATTSLPAATASATSVEYNGYVYEIGGCNPSCFTSTVDYASINANGTLGSWTATTSLLTATDGASSVAYNGYIYEIGGNTSAAVVATVDYAPINANGTLGAWTATTSLPAVIEYPNSVIYNGYVYDIGGYSGTAGVATVDYAALDSIPRVGNYSMLVNVGGFPSGYNATNSLPVATDSATSVVYNGYAYEIGGYSGSAGVANVDYAPINNDGTLGTWTATTNLPVATYSATSVVYNGYVYEIGGYTTTAIATVDYALICTGSNSGVGGCTATAGTLGTWTATTSLPATTEEATSIIYNGYVYEIGGCSITTTCPTATVDYALICTGSNSGVGGCTATAGTLGTWTATTSLPLATRYATSVTYNGYVYEIGGNTTAATATVDYALICTGSNSGVGGCSATAGTLGTWTAANSLPTTTEEATSFAHNGYVYEIGGLISSGTDTTTVDYAYLGQADVDPVSIILNGTNLGNPGIGGLSGLGGIRVKYTGATIACSTFSAAGYVNVVPPELGTAYNLTLTNDGCGNVYKLGTYIWVHIHLDDTQTATFPDINGNHTTITGFQIFYHPASSMRLRGGATFNGGTLQSLDAPPSTTQ